MFLCGTDIMKGVYYALVLTVRKPRKFSMQVKNKATVDAPWVCYIHTRYALIAIGVSVHQWNYRCSRCVIHIGVGLRRCSLRLTGQFPGASERGASIVQGFTLFLCPNLNTFESHLRLSESLTVCRNRGTYEYKVFQ